MENKKIKVLLVEDDKLSQKIAVIFLTAANCLVDVVGNGNSALEKTRQSHYDIIILDIGLPDIDGFTVAETIKREQDNDQKILLVALTAHTDSTFKKKSEEFGINAFMSKPLDMEKVSDILKKYNLIA